jgi:hypothetical protein
MHRLERPACLRGPATLATAPRNGVVADPLILATLPASSTRTTELPGTAQISREPMPPATLDTSSAHSLTGNPAPMRSAP